MNHIQCWHYVLASNNTYIQLILNQSYTPNLKQRTKYVALLIKLIRYDGVQLRCLWTDLFPDDEIGEIGPTKSIATWYHVVTTGIRWSSVEPTANLAEFLWQTSQDVTCTKCMSS